jgi:hypothetical protein
MPPTWTKIQASGISTTLHREMKLANESCGQVEDHAGRGEAVLVTGEAVLVIQ